MPNLNEIKDVVLITTPFLKPIIDTYLTPKIALLTKKLERSNNILEYSLGDKFEEYLQRSYKKYSILNTIVLHNQQQLLKNLYLPLRVISTDGIESRFVIDDFDDAFLPFYKKVLITDTAGMGKSTILKKLFLSIVDLNKGIPILIELRRLSKGKGIIREIIEQLNPINESYNEDLILDLIKSGDFIFLFDGFDEILTEERSYITTEIENFISKAHNNLFLMTSRPEGALASFGDFKQFKISPLVPDEAYQLLSKYNPTGEIAELLIKKIKESAFDNIKEFLTNPLLVSLLYTAFEYKQTIPFKKHIFYRQVFDAFFESHDLTKGDSYNRSKYCKLDIDDFHRVLRFVGYSCLIKGKIEFTKDEILLLLSEASSFVIGIEFKESDFLMDLVKTVPLFTIDGIYYKWSHKSLQEYFAAQFIYLDSKSKQKDILIKLYTSNENERFLNVLDLYYSIDYKSFKEIIVYDILLNFKKHLLESYKWCDFEAKEERQLITFGFSFILIKYKFNGDNNQSDKLWALLPSAIKGNVGWYLLISPVPDELLVNYVKIPMHKKPVQTILNFLLQKGEDIVRVHDFKTESLYLDLEEFKLYLVNDMEESLLNKRENFKIVNNLFGAYHDSILAVVIPEKVDTSIKEIQDSISKISSPDFLLNF